MVGEVLRGVARVVVGEQRGRGAPRSRVRSGTLDVLGDLATGEEPHGDAGAVPEVGEHASALLVEGVTETVAAVLSDGAAGVVAVRAGAGVALEVTGHGLDRVRDGAGGTSVERNLVVRVQVDTLWAEI